MKQIARTALVGIALAAFVGPVLAAGVFVYPQKGQSKERQDKDSYDCYQWARAQSGVDPSQPVAAPQPGQYGAGTMRGAARGAATGAAVGAIAGDAGKGAAAGAVVGGVRGRHRAREAYAQQANDNRNAYDRAFAACMEGRGYTVR